MNKGAAFQMILSMAIFGSIGFFTRKTGISAEALVFVRCICATIFLMSIWFIVGQYKKETWLKKEVLQTLFCGVFLVLNWVFLFKAFEAMSISAAISIYNLAPIFVLVMGTIFLNERINIQSVLAVTCCFIGSLLVVGLREFSSVDNFLNSGFIWAILSALCYAMTMVLGKGIQQLSAYATTFLQTIVGIIILAPIVSFSEFQGLTTSNWLYILGTGFIHTGFVYYLFFNSLRYLSALMTSALVFVDPLVAIALDVTILDFRPSVLQMLGMIFIFGGIVYTLLKPVPAKENTNAI
ncbi:DMT family transporter [Kurthia senegalensis]|uniref:DMT family transporter n=1 Tax=Kurthia senegalensis TaxID=1033740 RepID=UPI0002880265|nr:DMT family transporter [Kurthia senegalensis]